MRSIRLVPVGDVQWPALESLGSDLARVFGVECPIELVRIDATFAFHPERGQHHATEILARLMKGLQPGQWRILGVTGADLYIPILTFVFGEAQLDGPCAVVSTHRLQQEFYGLPPDQPLLAGRLLKEAVHEIGHTVGLRHCDDYTCAMASSLSVEQIDIKGTHLCEGCGRIAQANHKLAV